MNQKDNTSMLNDILNELEFTDYEKSQFIKSIQAAKDQTQYDFGKLFLIYQDITDEVAKNEFH